MNFPVNKIRSDFPILNTKVYGKNLVYLDNGATTQKPLCVLERIQDLYTKENSNIHRGVHFLSEQVTQDYEDARTTVQNFIGAVSNEEIVFTSGTTNSINLVAFSFGERYINEGDEIIISEMEHHANIVPWQMMCERKKAKLKVIPINDKGELEIEELKKLLSNKVKILSVSHVSNILGTINPIKEIVKIAHNHNIPVLVDGAQAIQHSKINVKDIDCDFYVFSGHKIYGPTGIGVLYGKKKFLEELPPYQGGGDMVDKVSFEKTTYNEVPFKFEAGTTNYIGAVGLAKAISYITNIGIQSIAEYEKELTKYAQESLLSINGLKIYGTSKNKVSVFSFLLKNIHQYDAGMVIDKMGIAVRTGTHCAQPLMKRFGIEGTLRASLCFYNTLEEIDKLHNALLKVKQMFD